MEAARHLKFVKPLAVFETVRCLECSEVYSKPLAGSTVHKNPGCPECGYVGWIPITLPPEPRGPHRLVEDLRLRLIARSR
jgi:hypothetical protein